MNAPLRLAPVFVLLFAACAADSKARSPTEVAAPAKAADSSEMQVVPLMYAPAEELAATLNKLLGDSADAAAHRLQASGGCALAVPNAPAQPPSPESVTRIVADPRTNSLIVQASPEEMPKLLDLIQRLDQKVQ